MLPSLKHKTCSGEPQSFLCVYNSHRFCSMYMALRDENGSPLSKKMLRDAVLNLIIAGRDTTAQALSWLFFRLLQNPSTLKPLQDEIDNFGELNYDNFKNAVQANAAFHEGLRLHPSVPSASPLPPFFEWETNG